MIDNYSSIVQQLRASSPLASSIFAPTNLIPHRNIRLNDADNRSLAWAHRDHGNILARYEMIEGNQGIVMSEALSYRLQPVPMESIVFHGGLALADAVETFNPDLEPEFSSHAVSCIRSRIDALLAGQHSPIGDFELPFIKVSSEGAGSPSDQNDSQMDILVKKLNWDLSQMAAVKHPASFMGEDETTARGLLPEPEPSRALEQIDHILCRELVGSLDRAVNKLAPDMQEMLARCFGLNRRQPESPQEIASSMGITANQARLRIHNALSVLRQDVVDA